MGAVTRHAGTVQWRREWVKPGIRVLFRGEDNSGLLNGAFWNARDVPSPATDPVVASLRDISGKPTTMGLRTLIPLTNAIGPITYTDIFGYHDDVWDAAYYTNGTARVEIYGIPKDHIVDLVLAGRSNSTSGQTRGGTYQIFPDRRQPELEQMLQDSKNTGPVMFAGIEPVDGSIQFELVKIQSFCYWNFFDLRSYRR